MQSGMLSMNTRVIRDDADYRSASDSMENIEIERWLIPQLKPDYREPRVLRVRKKKSVKNSSKGQQRQGQQRQGAAATGGSSGRGSSSKGAAAAAAGSSTMQVHNLFYTNEYDCSIIEIILRGRGHTP